MTRSVRGALLWSFAERYTSLAVTIASTMLLARLLTPQQVGVFSLCAAAVTIAGILRDFGVSEYLVQEKELDDRKLRNAFGVAILLGWSVGAVIFLARDLLADYYREPLVKDVLSVLTLNFLLLPLASPAFALLTRDLAFRKIFVIQTTCNIAQAVSAVSMALLGFGTMALAWAPVISIALQILMVAWARPKQTFLMPSLRGAAGVFKYGGAFALTRVIETTSRNTHEFMLARHLGFASVGLFSRALGLLEIFYNNFTAAILRVFTPMLAEDRRQGRSIPQRYAETTVLLSSLAWPILSYIALFSHDIIATLFGSQWLAAAPAASLLAIASMLSYCTVLGPTVLISTGHVKKRLRFTLITASVHITTVVLVSRHGLEAVAGAFVLSAMVGPSLYLYALPSLLGCTRRELLRGVGKSLRLGLGFAALLGGIALALHEAHLPSLLKLLISTLAGTAIWLALAHGLRHPITELLPGPLGRAWWARRQRAGKPPVIAYVISELGAISETFIYDEMLSVREAGVTPMVFYGRVSSHEATHANFVKLREGLVCLPMGAPERGRELSALVQWLLREPRNTLKVLARCITNRDLRWVYLETLLPAMQARAHGVTQFHAHFADTNAVHAKAMAEWCQVPFGITTHRYDIFEPVLAPDLLQALLAQAMPLVTISEFNRQFMASNFDVQASKVAIIRCGIDLARFSHQLRRRDAALTPVFSLFSVGRLAPEKAQDVLLNAVKLLKDQARDVRLTLAGTGPCEAALIRQMEMLGLQREVRLLGAQSTEQVIELHRHADAFVLSSLSEGLPVACIEALALGTPTVATAVAGIPELILHESSGLLVPAGSAQELAAAIARYMDDEVLRQSVSIAGRRWVELHFDRNTCTRQFLAASLPNTAYATTQPASGAQTCSTD